MSSYMAQVIGIKVSPGQVVQLLRERDPAFFDKLSNYIDPEDSNIPNIEPLDVNSLLDPSNPEYSTGFYYFYSALTRYQGQALYGLTATQDYLGDWYLGHVFNVVELDCSYRGRAPSHTSFSVKKLSEETQWTEYFLRKLGVLSNQVVEFHNTLHDRKFDHPVRVSAWETYE